MDTVNGFHTYSLPPTEQQSLLCGMFRLSLMTGRVTCIIILSSYFSLVHRRTSQLSPIFTVMEQYHAGKQQIDLLVPIKGEVH